MKTLIYFLLIPFAMFFSNQPLQHNFTDTEITKGKVEIEVEIEVGRKKKGCDGFGICKISGSAGFKGIFKGFKVAATATVQNGNVVSFNFHKKSMNKATFKKYFSKGYFRMKDSFDETLIIKGQEITCKINAGKYKLSRTKQGYFFECWPSKVKSKSKKKK